MELGKGGAPERRRLFTRQAAARMVSMCRCSCMELRGERRRLFTRQAAARMVSMCRCSCMELWGGAPPPLHSASGGADGEHVPALVRGEAYAGDFASDFSRQVNTGLAS